MYSSVVKKDVIQTIADPECSYMEDRWDSALLGFVEMAAGKDEIKTVPCYGYQAMKVLLKDKHYPTIYNDVRRAINTYDGLILHKLNSQSMWNHILASKFPRWEHLDKAVIGVLYRGWTPVGVCYNKPMCESIIEDTHAAVVNPNNKAYTILASLIPLYLGDHTPGYLTPITQ